MNKSSDRFGNVRTHEVRKPLTSWISRLFCYSYGFISSFNIFVWSQRLLRRFPTLVISVTGERATVHVPSQRQTDKWGRLLMRVVLLEMEETSKRSSDRTKHPIDTKVVPLDSACGDLSNDTSFSPLRWPEHKRPPSHHQPEYFIKRVFETI